MPEISDSELRLFMRYQNIGTPEEITKKIGDLETDNHDLREKRRDMEGRLPKDGEVVIPKADAELLPKYKELGTVDEIKGKLTEGETAKVKLSEVNARTAAAVFARAAGLADEAVDTLIAIPVLKDAKFEVRKGKVKDEKGNDVDGELPYLTLAGEGQKAMQFADAEKEIPALKGLARATAKKGGVTFVRQGEERGRETQGATVYDRIRQQREAEKTPAKDVPAVRPITERLGMTS